MLRIERVSHAYGEIVSLRDVSLDLEAGEILCLLGPSGCGKTTLLRIVAGLETDYDGAIVFDGEDIRPVPVHRRGFGLMFQDFALFPHLSTADNIAYGLKRLGLNRREIGEKVQSLLQRVGLEDFDERDVASLSGGQKQRVALARSLAPNPRLLMLDEPLGSLDAQLRDQLALELRQIIKSAGLSAIYVTHDRREAYAVADRIAVMNIGSVRQHGSPRQVYRRPSCAFVARFLGLQNVYSTSDRRITSLLSRAGGGNWRIGSSILIHPAGIRHNGGQTNDAIPTELTLEAAVFRGERYDLTATTDSGLPLSFDLSELPVNVGEKLTVHILPDAIIPLDD
ncbi:MAG: ABC transporter ATP-binding protein [Chloroflexi bacterium]|nr:ABC transporter ATP-binding protein [Chloroflexota bacterium]